jgi:aryl-alcohol dehydrogenase-like predicted oxidoreductase
MNYEQFRQAFGREGAYKTLRKMQEQRIIRAVGIGVRTHHFLMQAIREGVDVILPSFDFSPLRSSAEPIIECARRHGVAVVNASPYVGGLLAGPNPHEQAMRYKYIATNCPSDVDRASALWQWAQTTGLSIGALAVQWSVRNSSVTTTLFGPRTPEELEQNVAHAQETIATPDFELLKTFARSLGPWEEGVEQSWR